MVSRERLLQLRRQALTDGIDCIGWTFDPLELADAHVSVSRLGAIVERYAEDDDDRLLAEWWIRRPHVERRLSPPGPLAMRASEAAGARTITPERMAIDVEAPRVWVAVPAGATRSYLRGVLTACFREGYRIVDCEMDASGAGGRYLLARRS